MSDFQFLSQRNLDAFDEHGIPDYMRGGVIRWIEDGVTPGDFLTAVITNNLSEAVGRADLHNQAALVGYVKWFYNNAPTGCHGGPSVMETWPALLRERVCKDIGHNFEELAHIGDAFQCKRCGHIAEGQT
jgi:hypothetical protein